MAETSGDEMPRIYNIRQEFFGPRRLAVRIVQDVVLQLGETAVDFPPMQAPASFSLTRLKEQIQEMINHAHGAGGD